MAIPHRSLTQDDLKDPNLTEVNDIIRQLTDECNSLRGYNGTIKLLSPVDMSNNPIHNVGSQTASGDAISKTSGDAIYGPAVQQAALEATGTKILQTTRRLNDQSQQEKYSTFLNSLTSTPPAANTSQVTVVSAGANSVITVSAGNFPMADGSVFPYGQRTDTVANPLSGSVFYYYYLRFSDKTLQILGPYTADTSANRINANLDGRGFVAVAQVNAGGGGTGGGGGDNRTSGGCAEIGTPLKFPAGCFAWAEVLPCTDFLEVETFAGKRVSLDPNTLVSTFKKAKDLEEGDRVETEFGQWEQVRKVYSVSRNSHKVKITIEGGTYLAGGIRVHNFKPT